MKISTSTLFLAIVIASVGCNSNSNSNQSSSREQNIANAQGFFDDILVHNEIDRARARLAPNFEYRYMGTPDVPELAALTEPLDKETYFEKMPALVAEVMPDGIVLTTTHVVADESGVVILMEGDAQGPYGKYENQYAFYIEFKNGLISRLLEYHSDLLAMRMLLGYKVVAPE